MVNESKELSNKQPLGGVLMKRLSKLLAVTLTGGFLLAACGNDTTTEDPATEDPAVEEPAVEEEMPEEEETVEDPAVEEESEDDAGV